MLFSASAIFRNLVPCAQKISTVLSAACGPCVGWRSLSSAFVVVVVVVYFTLSRLLYLAFSANLGLQCIPHPGMGPLV